VLPNYGWKPIGGFRVVYEYANNLVLRGNEVNIIHARKLSDWNQKEYFNFYKRFRKKIGNIRDTFFSPQINWLDISKNIKMLYVPEPKDRYMPDADAVFATFWPTAEYVSNYSDAKGAKYYFIQDFYPYLGTKDEIARTWRFPLKKIVISNWLREQLIRNGVPKEDVFLIPNGINHKIFRSINKIENRSNRIVMMYSNVSYKAPKDGLEAINHAKKYCDNLSAICFGTKPRPIALPKWIEYAKNVKDEELVSIYNSSSIFISSSLAEGFALPPAEAMACGCAVAATDSGGIREYADHEITALLSPPNNPQKLANNLIRLLKDKDLRVMIAKTSNKNIKKLCWEKSTDQLEQYIEQNTL
jgi:glycosyltransferase involved in cell wall biosynthesis